MNAGREMPGVDHIERLVAATDEILRHLDGLADTDLTEQEARDALARAKDAVRLYVLGDL